LGHIGGRLDQWWKVEAGREVTQQVSVRKRDNAVGAVDTGPEEITARANKIHAWTTYDFAGRNLTSYGGLAARGSVAGEVALPGTFVGDGEPEAETATAFDHVVQFYVGHDSVVLS
jgi:hypothetical protein